MKKILLIILALVSLFLIGCSQIDYNERVTFCEERNMAYYDDASTSFKCKITDQEYRDLQIANLLENYREAYLYIIQETNISKCNISQNE